MKITPESYTCIRREPQRQLLADTFASDLPGATLSLIPIEIKFELSLASERWVEAMGEMWGSGPAEIIEICAQLGHYLGSILPACHVPKSSYPAELLGTFPLRFRVENLAQDFQVAKGGLDALLERALVAPKPESDWALTDPKPEAHSDSDTTSSTLRIPPEIVSHGPRVQLIAGDMVHYLFLASNLRSETPPELLRHLVSTAAWLDSNFADSSLPSLREELLAKTLAAQHLSLELNRNLSTLETFLCDRSAMLNNLETFLSRKSKIAA